MTLGHTEGAIHPSDFATTDAYVAAVKAQADAPAHADAPGKAAEHAALLNLVPRSEATHVAVREGSWFDPATWSDGRIPGAGAKVLIPEAISVVYDGVSDASLFTVRVDGHLKFAPDQNTLMEVDTLVVSGTGHLQIGSEDHPVAEGVKAEIRIAANGPIDVAWDPMLLSRGLISHGELEVYGQEKSAFLKLATDAMAGATQLTLAEDAGTSGWHIGDKIVLTGTHQIADQWDGTRLVDQGTQDEVFTIKAIDGNVITLDHALKFNHDAPRDDLKAYVANYTRNVVIQTENHDSVPVSERGHVMAMHSHHVDVRNAEFLELGRTDKSVRAVDASAADQIASDTNVKGRYAFHLHMTGVEPGSEPSVVSGNAVWGSPGWGFAQHGSNALLENNATFNTQGAGFVAETGDETGAWRSNIAILAPGLDRLVKDGPDVIAFDLARTGDGFWFQGRLVEAEGNVAAGVRNGFVYMHRGGTATVDAGNLSQPEMLRYLPEAGYNEPPIQHFSNNEVFAAQQGLIVVKGNPAQGHDVRSIIDNFTAWEVDTGIHLEYTAHYTLKDIDLVGTKSGYKGEQSWIGVDVGTAAFDIVLNRVTIDGFQRGVNLARVGSGDIVLSPDDFNYVFIDVDLKNISETAVANYDPRFDKILSSADLLSRDASLDLDFNGIPVWSLNLAGRKVALEGTKSDSIGTISYSNGHESLAIGEREMSALLSREGYYTTSDGRRIVIVEEYFSDRATGELFKVGLPIQLADDVPLKQGPWFLERGDAIWRGAIDLTSAAPVTQADTAAVAPGSSVDIDVLQNDTDSNSNTLIVDGLTQPKHGEVFVNETGSIAYRADRGFVGTDTFDYWATDNNGNFTRGSVTVKVGGTTLTGGSEDDTHIIDAPDVVHIVEQENGGSASLLQGGAGNDTLRSGAGNDILRGGDGKDSYYVDTDGDLVIELAGEGTDTVYAAVTYRLNPSAENGHIENLVLLDGTNAIDGTGNALDNRIRGNNASNALYGAEGNDVLVGGHGHDELRGGAGSDTFRFKSVAQTGSGAASDIILDFVAGEDVIDLQRIDADVSKVGNQAFSWADKGSMNASFKHVAGQVRFADGVLQGDIDGDGRADFEIRINGALDLGDVLL